LTGDRSGKAFFRRLSCACDDKAVCSRQYSFGWDAILGDTLTSPPADERMN